MALGRNNNHMMHSDASKNQRIRIKIWFQTLSELLVQFHPEWNGKICTQLNNLMILCLTKLIRRYSRTPTISFQSHWKLKLLSCKHQHPLLCKTHTHSDPLEINNYIERAIQNFFKIRIEQLWFRFNSQCYIQN